MKNKDKALDIVAKKRSSHNHRPNSVQARLVDWLMNNEDCEFTVSLMCEKLNVNHYSVSSALANTKSQLGFIYKETRVYRRCNHSVVYKLVDCIPGKTKSDVKCDFWKIALGASHGLQQTKCN